jgi:hypothetical protein
MLKNTLITVILFNLLFSQFNDIQISYEFNDRSIRDDKVYILEEFNSIIKNYLTTTQFSPEHNYLEIPLKIHLIYEKVNFIGQYEFDSISFQIFITNNAGQYYYMKNLSIPHSKGKNIYFNPTMFDPLGSLLDYYAFLFTGLELDSYDLYLGSTYYQKCLDLYSLSTTSKNASSSWSILKEDIEKIKDNDYLRKARYNFYFCIDMMNSDDINLKLLKDRMDDFLINLQSIKDRFGYEKNTLQFIDAFRIEIADMFKLLSINEGIEFLIKFDKDYESIYINYLK